MTSPIDNALRRLTGALDLLEAAVESRIDAGRKIDELESELQKLGLDRSRLAQAVDSAEARSVRLEDANKDVSRRLVTAMETIRGVIEKHEG
ncbi:DUF4164 domain-containing protein [Prosthecomicrobium pneumaticum]|uniref:DUF4164 family protein n=1 Tax=Prosthecomicrobium pneumaticum TaxID=81895 RepID=A0A7W9FKC5_9HYPH|nr:DUF4164 domain-containing protein [Prosthecomicrobium pneumaticum]MBB5752622.1 hypothetical protein [Prosthecomicrobium pneumaticum]